ncbi:hypothetical protein ABK040_016905 [Willaertia magna]
MFLLKPHQVKSIHKMFSTSTTLQKYNKQNLYMHFLKYSKNRHSIALFHSNLKFLFWKQTSEIMHDIKYQRGHLFQDQTKKEIKDYNNYLQSLKKSENQINLDQKLQEEFNEPNVENIYNLLNIIYNECQLLIHSPNMEKLNIHLQNFKKKLNELILEIKNDENKQNFILDKFTKMSQNTQDTYIGNLCLGYFYYFLQNYEKSKNIFLTLNLIDNQLNIEKGGTGETNFIILYLSFLNLGNLYLKLNKLEDAKTCYKSCLDLEGNEINPKIAVSRELREALGKNWELSDEVL